MSSRPEVIVFDCRDDDVATLRQASTSSGPLLHAVDSAVAVAHHVVAHRTAAVFIGVGRRSLKNLEIIPVIHAACEGLPVIVIADEDSLDLERRARSRSLFYYFVRPINPREVAAVLKDVLRHERGALR
jgi:DNA-binding NtrC family response regulator